VETSLVVCDFLVLDRQGHAVYGLTQDDFLLAEDDKPQKVGTFMLGDNVSIPRSIALIIDYSSSQFPFIKTSVEAAKTLVDKLGPKDTMAIITDDVELLQDFTHDKEQLKRKLEDLEKRTIARKSSFNPFALSHFGRSAQYSALMATLNEAFDSEDVRPIIIFQTDGDQLIFLRDQIVNPYIPPNLPPDKQKEQQKMVARAQQVIRENRTEFGLSDIQKAAERSRATIYTVIPSFRLIGLTPDQQIEQMKAYRERRLMAWTKPQERDKVRARMEERSKSFSTEEAKLGIERSLNMQLALAGVARLTGGWTDFLEDPSQAGEIYSRIFSDINRRYIIGYYPANKQHDGKRREVKIEVRGHPEYMIWGRKSYYAPNPEE
jgi:VWFA-related protein